MTGLIALTVSKGRVSFTRKASFEFAEGKPLKLLGGSNLLYLLKEYAGIDARIMMSEDWKDPQSVAQGE
jgi:hypothetical protein